ncbi:NAD(P)-binding domain-containing protein, partial [Raoultella sp. Ech2A]|uniref:NAD(P)-binding domain-containing protein n=1 Tax=Raoultella sp. Ech2A TaxID=2996539 RepID=UPI0032E04FB1
MSISAHTNRKHRRKVMPGKKLGFIGLGNMGGRMTRCLVDAGIEMLGFDPKPGAGQKA